MNQGHDNNDREALANIERMEFALAAQLEALKTQSVKVDDCVERWLSAGMPQALVMDCAQRISADDGTVDAEQLELLVRSRLATERTMRRFLAERARFD